MLSLKKFQTAALLLALLAIALMIGRPARASGPQQDGYPAPGEAELTAPETITVTQPYPAGGAEPDNPIPIGEPSGEGAAPVDSDPLLVNDGRTAQQPANRGLLYLWVGFLATFLVFLTSVVGAIVLFTRRNESCAPAELRQLKRTATEATIHQRPPEPPT